MRERILGYGTIGLEPKYGTDQSRLTVAIVSTGILWMCAKNRLRIRLWTYETKFVIKATFGCLSYSVSRCLVTRAIFRSLPPRSEQSKFSL